MARKASTRGVRKHMRPIRRKPVAAERYPMSFRQPCYWWQWIFSAR